jgi:hypothetical protein
MQWGTALQRRTMALRAHRGTRIQVPERPAIRTDPLAPPGRGCGCWPKLESYGVFANGPIETAPDTVTYCIAMFSTA